MRQRVAEKVKGTKVLAHAQIQEANRREQLRILWRKLERLQVRFDGTLVVFFLGQNLPELHEGGVVALDRIRALQGLLRVVEFPQVGQTQPLVVPDLPVVDVPHAHRFVEVVERRLVLAQQEERARHLLQVLDIEWVQASRLLEQAERLVDFAVVPQDERFDVQWVLCELVHLRECVLDDIETLAVLLAHIQEVDEVVALLPLLLAKDLQHARVRAVRLGALAERRRASSRTHTVSCARSPGSSESLPCPLQGARYAAPGLLMLECAQF